LTINGSEESKEEMITVEAWTAIRYLHAQGHSIRDIARELSVSRNTVRAALRGDSRPHYARPSRPNPQLEPFAAQIEQMLHEKKFIGTRILRELRGLGYEGSRSALYLHLNEIKTVQGKTRVIARFETPPGQQGQFDWSPYSISLGGQAVKVTFFGLALAYSRRKFYSPSLDATQASIFEALEAGLWHFGGAPKEVLVDNARSLVLEADPERPVWNPHFLELCGHYRLQPRACQAARPQTKGKVERPFYYLEQHFIKGNAWADWDALVRDLEAFIADDLDQRRHGTTGEPPIERFAVEREALTPLPLVPFMGTHELSRKVSWDCLVPYGGSRYSVPWPYAGKQVWLRLSQGRQLVVRGQDGQEIARHNLVTDKHRTVLVPEHYDGLRRTAPKTRTRLEHDFLQRFPQANWFVEALFIQHKNNGLHHLRAILQLADLYPPDVLLWAFERARLYNTYSHVFLRGLLEANPERQAEAGAEPAARSAIGADLQVYQRLLEVTP
jgi:transposase